MITIEPGATLNINLECERHGKIFIQVKPDKAIGIETMACPFCLLQPEVPQYVRFIIDGKELPVMEIKP